ncbi:MAG: aspartate/glutamate racemase family protein [Mycobacteriaceae bacterium]
MRLRAVTPIHVDATELARRQRRYERLAPAGVTVALSDLGDGPDVPRALESADDVHRSEALLVAALQTTDPGTYDGFLPDCVLDPGVQALGPVPVLGLLRCSSHLLAAAGRPFAAVARNQAIADELGERLELYGLAAHCVQVRVLGLSVEDIDDDSTWAESVGAAVADLEVSTVINGCSAVDVSPAGSGPRVLDPTATALQVLGLLGDLRLLPGVGSARNSVTW